MPSDTLDHAEVVTAKRKAKTDPTGLLAAIKSAGKDPNVAPEKLDSLIALYERVDAREAKKAYMAALAVMRLELPVLSQRGTLLTEDNEEVGYALWEDICDDILPVITGHGFTLAFRSGPQLHGKISVIGVLAHREGHEELFEASLPPDPTGGKNPLQAIGSATSYAKRYAATALLNLTSRGEDDGGLSGGGEPAPGFITEDQVGYLQAQVEAGHGDLGRLLAYFKVRRLSELPSAKFDLAVEIAQARARA